MNNKLFSKATKNENKTDKTNIIYKPNEINKDSLEKENFESNDTKNSVNNSKESRNSNKKRNNNNNFNYLNDYYSQEDHNSKNKGQNMFTVNDILGEDIKREISLDIMDINFEHFFPGKVSLRSYGPIKAYAANTNQGIVRDYNEDRVSIIINLNKN